MKIEELKEEAKRQGYKLIKKQENIRLLPCTCGRKRIQVYINSYPMISSYAYRCPKCGNIGDWATTKLQARKNWNNADWR